MNSICISIFIRSFISGNSTQRGIQNVHWLNIQLRLMFRRTVSCNVIELRRGIMYIILRGNALF